MSDDKGKSFSLQEVVHDRTNWEEKCQIEFNPKCPVLYMGRSNMTKE